MPGGTTSASQAQRATGAPGGACKQVVGDARPLGVEAGAVGPPASEAELVRRGFRYADRLGRHAGPARGFTNVPGHGAVATVDGHRVVVGNARLLDQEGVAFDGFAAWREELAAGGRTVVLAAVDGRAAAVIAIADAARPTAEDAVAEHHDLGVRAVMLRRTPPPPGGSPASSASTRSSRRSCPARKQDHELQAAGRKVARSTRPARSRRGRASFCRTPRGRRSCGSPGTPPVRCSRCSPAGRTAGGRACRPRRG